MYAYGKLEILIASDGSDAAINSRINVRGQLGRILRMPTLFVTVNAAFLVGLVRWLRKQQSGVWVRTPRAG